MKKLWNHELINLRKFQLMERRYPKEAQYLYEKMRWFARIVRLVEPDKFTGKPSIGIGTQGKSKGSRNTGQQALPIFVAPEPTITRRLKKRNPSNAEWAPRSSSASRTAVPASSVSASRLTLILAWVLLFEFRDSDRRSASPLKLSGLLAQRSWRRKKRSSIRWWGWSQEPI